MNYLIWANKVWNEVDLGGAVCILIDFCVWILSFSGTSVSWEYLTDHHSLATYGTVNVGLGDILLLVFKLVVDAILSYIVIYSMIQ